MPQVTDSERVRDLVETLLSQTDHYKTGMGNLERSDEENIHYRNEAITEVVKEFKEEYVKSNATKREFSDFFFWSTMRLFIGLVGFCLVIAICGVFMLPDNEIGSAVAIVTSLGTVIVAVIALPKIIAEHLFPAGDRDKSINMIQAILESDLEMRKYWEYDKQRDEMTTE